MPTSSYDTSSSFTPTIATVSSSRTGVFTARITTTILLRSSTIETTREDLLNTGDGVHTSGLLSSYTATTSSSSSSDDQPPQTPIPTTSLATTTTRTVTGSTVAATTLMSPADISNANTLIMVARLDCQIHLQQQGGGGNSINSSMRDGSLSSYMISPFMDFGWVAVAWGNLALSVVGGFGVNAIVATLGASVQHHIGRRRLAAAKSSSTTSTSSVFATAFQVDALDPNPLTFPALGLAALMFWVPGSVLGAVALLMGDDDDGATTTIATTTSEYIAAVTALCSCLGIVVAWELLLVRRVLPQVMFTATSALQGNHNVSAMTRLVPPWVPWWLLPTGVWSPPSL
ncbi:transmembrane protein, putative, partial [Bodo saltans]